MNKILKLITLSIAIAFSCPSALAQNVGSKDSLRVGIELINPSTSINDGQIKVKAIGGVPPYTYQWSNQNTPLTAADASGLMEGAAYTVVVSDSKNRQVSRTVTIEPTSITENFNALFDPAVQWMSTILFWDPFAAIGLYDPVVYTHKEMIKTPHWTATTDSTFTLKKKLVPDGALVQKGDEIALISIENGEVVTAKATATGTINFNVAAGKVIFSPNNTKDLIEQGAQYFASVSFDEKRPLLYPNGEIRKNSIPFIVVWLILGAAFFTIRMGFINISGFKHAI
jgi:AGCS family alanine or glycine:cation symporter